MHRGWYLLAVSLVVVARASTVLAQEPSARPAPAPDVETIAASPGDGFHHPYLLVLPENLVDDAPLVVALPTPATSDDPAVWLAAARRIADNAAPLMGRLGFPVLVPVLPRPPVKTADGFINLYLPALTRAALLAEEPSLARVDRQVLAMADDARRRVSAERDVKTRDRFVLVGFSAGGHFATRMAVLHPRRVLAVWAGGTGAHPIVPLTEYQGRRLPYPVGVADLADVAGEPFDAGAFAAVPLFVAQGEADANSSLPAGPGPSDSYSPEHARLAFELFGTTAAERLGRVKAAYAAAGARAEFRVYPGAGHRITPEIARDIVAFIREQVSATRPRPQGPPPPPGAENGTAR